MLLTSCVPKQSDSAYEAETPTDVGVEASYLKRDSIHRWVEVYGLLSDAPANPDQSGGLVTIKAAIEAPVARVLAMPGQEIAAGQLLILLDDGLAKARMHAARDTHEFAQKLVSRQLKLDEIGGTTKQKLADAKRALALAEAELESSMVALKLVQIHAPMHSTLERLGVHVGENVMPGDLLVELIANDQTSAELSVPVTELNGIHIGQRVVLHSTRGQLLETSVQSISARVGKDSQSVVVRASLPADSGWRPGELVSGRIETETHEQALLLPVEALYTNHKGLNSIAVIEDGIAKRHEIKVGLRERGWIEILGSDFTQETQVATQGSFGLPDETRVHILNAAQPGEESQ